MELIYSEYEKDYDVEILQTIPVSGADYIFRREPDHGISKNQLNLEIPTNLSDWLLLKINYNKGKSWVGIFEPGPEGISKLFTTPSKMTLCVVLKGQGYWVPIGSPKAFEVVCSLPIKEVIAVPKGDKMIFVDYVRIAAYGESGFLWQTNSLSWDGLKIIKVTSTKISGIAWDAPNNKEVDFFVNIENGASEGGASPEN